MAFPLGCYGPITQACPVQGSCWPTDEQRDQREEGEALSGELLSQVGEDGKVELPVE